MKIKSRLGEISILLIGIGLFTLVTWKWNVAVAAWLAPVFLIRYFRSQPRWLTTLPAVFLLCAASYVNKTGSWGMDPLLEVLILSLAALPVIVALFLDRFAARRLPVFWASLVFPASYVALDYVISFLPLGTVLSLSPSQFYSEALVQSAAVTGIWGIEFLVLWTAPIMNALWEHNFDIRPVRVPVIIYTLCITIAFLYGGIVLVVNRPITPTVRVAGVSVAHAHNYWNDIIDKGTPEAVVQSFAPEIQTLEDQLFLESENAARGGARVIFWSEADAFLLPGRKASFMQRARDFARQHRVYFMPAYQELRYGDTSGFNGLAMITPQGEMAYEYEKTKSWYATTSDGLIHSIDTPYGRIGAVICFDMDFPSLIRQAARQNVDIMLVPAFDTYQTRVYHSEVGLLRSVEDGMSVFRMVNEGTSIAVDYRGHLLASQDFFTTPSRILFADLHTQGVSTIYGQFGDWFAYLCILLVAGTLLGAVVRPASRLVQEGAAA